MVINEREVTDMQDAYKRETAVGFTVWDINCKCAKSKSRHKDAKREIRAARRKAKLALKSIDKNSEI